MSASAAAAPARARCGASSRPSRPMPPTRKLTVSDATVTEALGAQLVFTVSLDRAVTAQSNDAVTVDYATRDGTATAGADYTSASGTLVFGLDERTKSVHVAVVDDNHNDGNETMELVLSNAVGATIEDGTGTGTINNADPMPEAWLARFGRTVAEQVLDGVAGRLEARRRGKQGGDAGGPTARPLRRGGACRRGDVRRGRASVRRLPWREPDDDRARGACWTRLFSLTGERDGSDGALGLWGRATRSSFAGEDGTLSLDGDVTTAMLGDGLRKRRVARGSGAGAELGRRRLRRLGEGRVHAHRGGALCGVAGDGASQALGRGGVRVGRAHAQARPCRRRRHVRRHRDRDLLDDGGGGAARRPARTGRRRRPGAGAGLGRAVGAHEPRTRLRAWRRRRPT